jgi:hypothetical protein
VNRVTVACVPYIYDCIYSTPRWSSGLPASHAVTLPVVVGTGEVFCPKGRYSGLVVLRGEQRWGNRSRRSDCGVGEEDVGFATILR